MERGSFKNDPTAKTPGGSDEGKTFVLTNHFGNFCSFDNFKGFKAGTKVTVMRVERFHSSFHGNTFHIELYDGNTVIAFQGEEIKVPGLKNGN